MFEKERKFHKERWQRKSDQLAGRSALQKFRETDTPDLTPDEIRDREAERDDTDFEKRKHEEFREWQKSLKVVIENFLARVKNPEDTENSTMIIMMGGGMKGPYTAGQAIALLMMGISPKTVDMVIGSSTGAVVATAFAAGLEATLKSTVMMLEELASENFIDTARFWEIIKLRLIKQLWTETNGEYALDTEAIRKENMDLLYTVTEPVKGDEEPVVKHIDAKTIRPGMIDGVVSSMSIPYVTGEIPEIDGVKNYDGGFGRMDIKNEIEQFKKRHGGRPPKNILILPTMPFETLDEMKPTPSEIKFAKFARRHAGSLVQLGSLGHGASLKQIEKGLLLKYEQRKAFELIQKETGVNIGVLWPPNSDLTNIGINGDDMTEAVLSSARDTFTQCGMKQPDEIPLYESRKTRLKKLKEAIENFKLQRKAA